MMVLFVSQCEKRALKRTRRVLDTFAERIGDNTWRTAITAEGLKAVRKLLRKSATKNTAVSCHWIRSRSHSELLWVVGNRDKFDSQGAVPVHRTKEEIDKYMDKISLKYISIMQSATSIAALFHDFGKATKLFQNKINPERKTINYEPFRHEWVSYRLFQAFVGLDSDREWLERMIEIDGNGFPACYKDKIDNKGSLSLTDLAPFARLVAWLIVTHHKLPLYPGWLDNFTNPPGWKYIDEWIENNFTYDWNSFHAKDENLQNFIKDNWSFDALPIISAQWRSNACSIASRALVDLQHYQGENIDWLDEHLFVSHFSRMSMVLADHYYSSLTSTEAKIEGADEWKNIHYHVYANTQKIIDRHTYKQQLDEHLIGVAKNSREIIESLTKLNNSLPQLDLNERLTMNVGLDIQNKEKRSRIKEMFGWQDRARKVAENIGKETEKQGFFGINMASTGKGKTRANAKIMAAVGLQIGRVRFSVALGLRVLTLQTGKEFQDELNLQEDELAVAVGGVAAKELFESQYASQNRPDISEPYENGSESAEPLIGDEIYVKYLSESSHSLKKWTKIQKNLDGLLSAPVLVCTIDHLALATEATKGGRHIAAMLRLFTSDLVLDEPDDFGLSDLPALSRLVHWAGMCGSRVLLSTATMPPALANALYQSYRAGWSEFAKSNIDGWSGQIRCMWFDENKTDTALCREGGNFKELHRKFIQSRTKFLENELPKRLGKIVPIEKKNDENIEISLAKAIQTSAIELHRLHAVKNGGKSLSVGLVRMANINPLVKTAKALLSLQSDLEDEICIHYCVYHSRFPLAIRSHIEYALDRILRRKDPDAIWQHLEIREAIEKNPTVKHHIFIVLASPVAEVGRDHDYDWAIVEPSSMRSIIQLAGRILRHRNIFPEYPNVYILQKNYKALRDKELCFVKPGFESAKTKMGTYDMNQLLPETYYKKITAIPRIELPKQYKMIDGKFSDLVEMEHKAMALTLFSGEKPAKVWWAKHPHWCGEVQRQQPFRESTQEHQCMLWINDNYSRIEWRGLYKNGTDVKHGDCLVEIVPEKIEGSYEDSFFIKISPLDIYEGLSKKFQMELDDISKRFGTVSLPYYNNDERYLYHPQFGLYQEIGD